MSFLDDLKVNHPSSTILTQGMVIFTDSLIHSLQPLVLEFGEDTHEAISNLICLYLPS